MRPYSQDIDVATVDPDGLADGNSSAGATLTLDGALTSGGTFTSADGLAHRLDIIDTSTLDQTGATYTITGTDADGIAETEAIAGPGSGATIETTKYFKTVTSITITSPVAVSTVDVGTVDEVVSKTVPLNYRNINAATYSVDVTGTINYTVKETLDSIHDLANPSADSSWHNLTALAAKTADLTSVGTVNMTGCQLVVNSYSTGAEIQFTVMQNESI
jgi:hypothetical protein